MINHQVTNNSQPWCCHSTESTRLIVNDGVKYQLTALVLSFHWIYSSDS